MIIYKENNKLITTTIGDVTKNLELVSLYSEAESFKRMDNRFFKIISEDSVNRSIKYPLHDMMREEAIKKFRQITNVYAGFECYDKEQKVGYSVFPYMKNPTVYSYSIIYPAITKFFKYWKEFNYTAFSARYSLPNYDLSSLFDSMDNFKDLKFIFTKEQGECLKKTLYKEFPEFAIFYYEIYPYLNLEIVNSIDIAKLINARMLVDDLGLDTSDLDIFVDSLDVAKNNGKVLRLIKNSK